MKPVRLALILLACGPAGLLGQPQDYEKLKQEGEKLHAEGSYALAHDVYLKADALDLPPADARWVDFRVADTLWRSQAGSQTADASKFDKARQDLEALVRDIRDPRDRDLVWAEVEESLGDFFWGRRDAADWGSAWPHYQNALGWWAGSTDLELARKRYLKVVWTSVSPAWREPHHYYGYHGNLMPVDVLENVLKIAASAEDKAHAHYLLAMTFRMQGGDPYSSQRAGEEFEAALDGGKANDWYDDALYRYAEWMAGQGRFILSEDGGWRVEPDFLKALSLYRKLTTEFKKGETRYFDQALQAMESITSPSLGASVSNAFLPGSEIEFQLSWRNIKKVDLSIHRIDLSRDVKLDGEISLGERQKIKSWSRETGDAGEHRPGQEAVHLEEKLPLGAYLLEARSGSISAKDLILVTDAVLVLKTSARQALAYFCDAMSGSPIPEARVIFRERIHAAGSWREVQSVRLTGADGLARFDRTREARDASLLAVASLGDRQAFSRGASDSPGQQLQWRMYAFTDRPAYRPGERVEWKVVARRYDGASYSTPAGGALEYQINDPRGAKAGEGKLALNDFGSAWGSLELKAEMPLGQYQVTFWDEGRRNHLGSAVLFQLEEYKLPEFKVAIRTPEEGGRKKAFRLGDKVEVSVEAEYYFGGPVANATAEVVVYQSPFYHYWFPEREFPWYYDDASWRRWGGRGSVIQRETLKTDGAGRATLAIQTPRGSPQDMEYRIEARVTDASRREVVGSDTVRVTKQRYSVSLRPEHNLYRPRDAVKVNAKAMDANSSPMEVEGSVSVTCDRWVEVWISPDGKEVRGDELKALRAKSPDSPPPVDAEGSWRLKFRGYEHEEVLARKFSTSKEGEVEISFTPQREGYYRVAWTSEDKGGPPVRAEAFVWVATERSGDLGYRHGGLEILIDKDTVRPGEKLRVMLSLAVEDRHVLFAVEGDELYSYQLVHVPGKVKLLEVPLEEKHAPNVFLSAVVVTDREMWQQVQEVVVPPVKQFLQLEVKLDREDYEPREEGTITVTARDDQGKPVSAEVALGLADESVFYISQDPAPDPRQFFYGQKRWHQVSLESTFGQKRYARLVRGADGRLQDESQAALRKDGYRVESFEEASGMGGGYELQELAKKSEDRAPGNRLLRSQGKLKGLGAANALPREMALTDKAMDGVADFLGQAAAPAKPGAAGGEEEPAVVVRSDFRSTVFWQPDVRTGPDGKGSVKVRFPDSLTSWRATARGSTRGNQFGIGKSSARTRLPLMARLQAPRFFVVGDTAVISANITNNTRERLEVQAKLEAEGLDLQGFLRDGKAVSGDPDPVTVPAGGEARVDWLAHAARPGPAGLKVTARGGKHADAMAKDYTIHEHGVEKFISRAGKSREGDVAVELSLPPERRPGSTSLTVQVSPSLAVTLLDALPYLIDYPYGCTEQTMSRFLPTVIAQKALQELGIPSETISGRIFGGIEEPSREKTHPGGKKDLKQIQEMANAGLSRLYDFQHPDGGWGWWKEGESDHFMTAYVVWGLSLGLSADLDVRAEALDRGAAFLDKELVEEEANPDLQAWMLHAVSLHRRVTKRGQGSEFQAKAFENLWNNKDKLNAYARALLALSAHHRGDAEKAQALVRNLQNGVKVDAGPEGALSTAHWGEDGIAWRWSDGGVEATAFALQALLVIEPENKLVDPVTTWLVKNRRGAQWSNTRDTAIVVLALTEYLRKSGEAGADVEYELLVNGKSVGSRKVTPREALSAPSRFAVEAGLVADSNKIQILRKSGKSPLYFAVEARFFSLEEPVTPAGNEIFARREYVKIVPQATLLAGFVPEKAPLADQGTVTSGERVEVILTIEAKNNYEYLVFEDLKPAGLEAVQLQSGAAMYARELKSAELERKLPAASPGADEGDRYTGRTRWVYQELRDRKVALFIDKLPEGIWELRYELRAEVPGKFHGLPVLGHAMYVPEIRCNGAETRIEVKDRPPEPEGRRAVVLSR